MAAYASLNSVMYILQQIQHHPHPPITVEKQHMDSLCENISFLQDFLENYSHRDIGGCLESQIADAAYAAEDVIESHIVDQILAKSTFLENNYTHLFCQGVDKITQILSGSTSHGKNSSYTIFRRALQKVIGKGDSVQKEVMVKIKRQQPSRKNSTTMLGFDEVLSEVMDRLTAQQSNPQILQILGMSGIALISLVHIRELILHSPCFTSNLGKSISIWESFLRDYTNEDEYEKAQDFLETQIVDAACAAEDIIQSQLVGIIHPQCNNLFYQDLQKVIKDMNLITKEVIEIQEKWRIDDHQMPRDIISMSVNIGSSSTAPPPIRKNANAMVGFDDVLVEIVDRLTGHQPNRQVLPIVGMGGIGKTTLARNVYDHPYIVHHFDNRVWITVSQQYGLREILVGALFCVGKTYQNHENKSSEDELGDQLYKSLSGRRYLIILDDMWSIEAWEELKFFFPDNKNGSRIVITTRLSNVAKCCGSSGFKMNFLDEDKSWKLLHKIVFSQDQCCPQEFEETGKKIARNCKGLPLSIVVIGGLLANSEMTRQHWEYVGKNLNSMVNLEDDQHCLKILFLSYNHLPVHLKPCFLYMGVCPEDRAIRVSQLTKLWVDEGFLKPIKGKTLEMAAREYFNELIDRNLILVHKWGSIGEVKVCKIHDVLRDLCLREAQKNKFLWVRRVHDLDNLEGIQIQRRISIHEGTSKEKYHSDRVLEALTSAPLARSLTSAPLARSLPSHCFRLLRVSKMVNMYSVPKANYGHSLKDLFKLVNSRYLDFRTQWKSPSIFPLYLDFRTQWKSPFIFPSSIHLLWNLQTLILKNFLDFGNIPVPPEIWEMSQLRNLEIEHFSLPDPPNVPLIHDGGDDELILRNLHTLKTVTNFKLSEEVIKRIPNIKKLRVGYYDFHEGWCHNYRLNNLGRLNKLESLFLIFYYGVKKGSYRIEMIQNLAFPHSLNKLTLVNTPMLWEDMRVIGSLPHLQVLKLCHDSFRGLEWNPVEGEFLSLKFLLIEECRDLVYWNANRTHFPCLEQLVLRELHKLEIPLDIGQISTLRSIELSYCGDSVVISAKNLLDEQVELGNEDLRVRVFCEKNIELERMATHNFQVQPLIDSR